MKTIHLINRFSIKPGKMDEFIDAQRSFAAKLAKTPCGLLGGRTYRGLDGTSAVLVSTFESLEAQERIRQLPASKSI